MKYPNAAESLPEFFEFLWFDFRNLFPRWMAYPIKEYRQYKDIKAHPPGTYIEDCSYHPCIIVVNDKGDLESYDMIKHHTRHCSLFHCGIRKITQEKAFEMVEAYKRGGYEELNKVCGFEEEKGDEA